MTKKRNPILNQKVQTFQLENHIGVQIKKAARLFEQVANRNLDKLGVTYSQTIFLVRLWERDGQNQMELAKSAGLRQPTVVRILDRMERDGLVRRARNQEDRRVFNFFLTMKAKKACQKLESHANAMNEIATKSLTKNESENLKDLISHIIQNLQSFIEKGS